MIYEHPKKFRTSELLIDKSFVLFGPQEGTAQRVDSQGAIANYPEDQVGLYISKDTKKVWVKK